MTSTEHVWESINAVLQRLMRMVFDNMDSSCMAVLGARMRNNMELTCFPIFAPYVFDIIKERYIKESCHAQSMKVHAFNL